MSKRKINGKFVSLVCLVLLIVISLIKFPALNNYRKLQALGYSEEAIQAIYDKGLKKTILDNGYYSDFLNSELTKDSFDVKYLQLYLNRDSLSQDDIALYERLKSFKGYTDDELLQLFTKLNYANLQPLLIFDKLKVSEEEKVDDINKYVEDCLSHPTNTKDSFKLKYDYLKEYEDVTEIENPGDKDVFVSLKRSLGEYVPANLETVSRMNAIDGIQLEATCKEHFDELCAGVRTALTKGIYAVGGYISYDSQTNIYSQNQDAIRPGFNEKQTGLVVTVVSSENEDARKFMETEAYKWLLAHAHEYGFILRYPQGKEIFTEISNPYQNTFRYVGPELAGKIHSTGLSFDEYYYYYLAQ